MVLVFFYHVSVVGLIGGSGSSFVDVCVFNCSLCWSKLYSSLCIVLGGLMMLSFLFMIRVYGCGASICLLGGFFIVAILSRRVVGQSRFGNCNG